MKCNSFVEISFGGIGSENIFKKKDKLEISAIDER
jgi:hypothetical protein